MLNRCTILQFFLAMAFVSISFGQTSSYGSIKKLDSLFNELKKNNEDTTIAKINYRIGFCYAKNDLKDSAMLYYNKALEIAIKANFELICVKSNKEIAFSYYEESEMDSAFKYFNRALAFIHSDNTDYYEVYSGMGTVCFFKGNFIKSYEYYLKSLRIAEKTNKKNWIARSYGNVGVALKEQMKLDDALIFFIKALEIGRANDLKAQTYVALTNIGNIYSEKFDKSKSDYDVKSALSNYLEAKKIVMHLIKNDNDRSNAVTLLGNIGNTYADIGDYSKALEAFKECLDLMGDGVFLGSKSMLYNNLASVYVELKNTKEAEKYLKLATQAANESQSPSDIMENYKCYSSLYEIKGDYKNAYLYHYRYKKLSDSLFSTENAEKRKEIELNMEFEKKEATAKIELEKKEAIDNAEKHKQQILRNSLMVGIVLMLLVVFLVFRSYRIKKKSNEIIIQQKLEVEKQKEIIEVKQKEIVDSIHYAKRIQQSLLPTKKYIDKTIKRLNE